MGSTASAGRFSTASNCTVDCQASGESGWAVVQARSADSAWSPARAPARQSAPHACTGPHRRCGAPHPAIPDRRCRPHRCAAPARQSAIGRAAARQAPELTGRSTIERSCAATDPAHIANAGPITAEAMAEREPRTGWTTWGSEAQAAIIISDARGSPRLKSRAAALPAVSRAPGSPACAWANRCAGRWAPIPKPARPADRPRHAARQIPVAAAGARRLADAPGHVGLARPGGRPSPRARMTTSTCTQRRPAAPH